MLTWKAVVLLEKSEWMFVFRLWSPAPSSSVLGTPANVQWTWHGNSNCLLGVAACCQEWNRSAGRKQFNYSFSAPVRGKREDFERFTDTVNLCLGYLNALLITSACQEVSIPVLLEVWVPSQGGLGETSFSRAWVLQQKKPVRISAVEFTLLMRGLSCSLMTLLSKTVE